MDALERIERAVGKIGDELADQGKTLVRVDERTLQMQDALEREISGVHHRITEIKEGLDARVEELAARPAANGSNRRIAVTTGGGVVGTLGLVQLLDWFKDPHNAAWLKRLLGIS